MFLAIDIGASSGRHMLGWMENGQLKHEEIHRFPNEMITINGHLCWNIDALFGEILAGMKKCAALGKIPQSVGIDTWGVDFVLLDEGNKPIGLPIAYRDNRTDGMDEEVSRHISEKELYARTGIQKMIFNTIYQLMAVKIKTGEELIHARKLLMVPDYLHFLLSGVAKNEYTIATTTGLVNALTCDWDMEIIKACGYPPEIFGEIVPSGTVLGELTPDIQKAVGYNCRVVLPPSHDTAAAVAAVPATPSGNTIFISSGTWSLMGVERGTPDCSETSRAKNFTNEGGYNNRYRYLKNIMGLWMIQNVKKELDDKYSYAQLCEMAEASEISAIIDVNDKRFLAPQNMTKAVQELCAETNQPIPVIPGEIAAVIYNSLAKSYADTAKELEELTGQTYDAICIVGGGAKAEYLNNLTAKYTGKTVIPGPSEATAIGNLTVLYEVKYE